MSSRHTLPETETETEKRERHTHFVRLARALAHLHIAQRRHPNLVPRRDDQVRVLDDHSLSAARRRRAVLLRVDIGEVGERLEREF